MRPKVISAVTAISLCAVLTCAAVFAVIHGSNSANEPYIISNDENNITETHTGAAVLNADTANAGQDRYIIRAYKGEICIFYGSDLSTPAVFTGIELSGLRNSDKNIVNEGIILDSYEKVVAILEDFGS